MLVRIPEISPYLVRVDHSFKAVIILLVTFHWGLVLVFRSENDSFVGFEVNIVLVS